MQELDLPEIRRRALKSLESRSKNQFSHKNSREDSNWKNVNEVQSRQHTSAHPRIVTTKLIHTKQITVDCLVYHGWSIISGNEQNMKVELT
jgi:hypothetical protein